MEISVTNLWIVYFASLVVLSLIGAFITYKSGSRDYSCAVLISSILSAMIVYLVAYYNIEATTLSAQDKSSLEALYLSALVIIALAFIWCITALAMKSTRAVKEAMAPKLHAELECVEHADHLDCEVKKESISQRDMDGSFSKMEMKCDDETGCSPSSFYMRDRTGNTLNIKYLA